MELTYLSLLLLPVTLGVSVPSEELFDVFGTGFKEWRLVFRGAAYTNQSMFFAYTDGSNLPAMIPDACKQINWTQPCDTHFRNGDALRDWTNIMRVFVGLIDGGNLVKTIMFDGANTDYLNWFSTSHFVSSSWSDLDGQTPQSLYFSVRGDGPVKRRFFINNNYDGCGNDAGWLAVLDTEAPAPCNWEKHDAFPVIKYAAGNTYENWTTGNFRKADALVVFVKYSSQAGIIG